MERSTEDQILIRRTLAGSQQAYGQLVDRYRNYVFTVCLRVLKSREAAEEAAQDSFVKAYRSLASYQGESRFSSWLYTIAYRTALDRARLKQQPLNSLEEEGRVVQVADPAPGAADQMESRDLQIALGQAIQALKPEDATVVSLYYLQEQNVQEISAITGLSASNIKTKLFRSREKLRQLLSQQLHLQIEDYL